MIEINLLKQGHGILYRQKYIKKNIVHRRTKILLLLILLLSSLTVYFTPGKSSHLNKFIIAKLISHLDIVWFEEKSPSFPRWFEDNLLLFKDQMSFQKFRGYTSGIVRNIIPKEETFYVRVASTLFPEEADTIQKDILAKGFESDRGTYSKRADKFFVVIDQAQTKKSVDSVLDAITDLSAAWEIQVSENKETEIISQSFFFLKEAEQIKKQILKKGLKGKIIIKKLPTIFHEVRVGKFKNRAHAIHLLNQLQKAGMEGTILKR
tara:strand:- start:788 stop:1579 length:792 start_codon:yes stop_codon:yes gene_type:complete